MSFCCIAAILHHEVFHYTVRATYVYFREVVNSRIMIDLQYNLCSKLDDGSASPMQSHHLISNTN